MLSKLFFLNVKPKLKFERVPLTEILNFYIEGNTIIVMYYKYIYIIN